MVKPLSATSEHCAYMLSTEFVQDMQLCTQTCVAFTVLPYDYILLSAFFFLPT